MSIINKGVKSRIKNIINLLDIKDSPYVYIFFSYDNGKSFCLSHNEDTLIDDNITFDGVNGVETFIKKESDRINHTIKPVYINIVDNSHLERYLYDSE